MGIPGPRRARGGSDGRLIRTGSPTGSSATTSSAAALEITLVGPELRATGELVVCGRGRRVRGARRRRGASNAARRSASRAAATLRFGRRLRRRALDPGGPRRDSTCLLCSAAGRRASSAAWARSADARSPPAISSADRPRAQRRFPRSPRVSRCVCLKAARACAPSQARTRRASRLWRSSDCSRSPLHRHHRSRIAWDSGSRVLSCRTATRPISSRTRRRSVRCRCRDPASRSC